jgi:hypothetical protein
MNTQWFECGVLACSGVLAGAGCWLLLTIVALPYEKTSSTCLT